MHSPVLELALMRLSNGGYYIFTTKVPSRYLRECIESAEPEPAGEERRNDSSTYLPISDVKVNINVSKSDCSFGFPVQGGD